jgi:nicotinate-nucleotide pyrophosphorylase (carboxylating)
MVFDARHPQVLDAVRRALAEDVGTGDVTTELTVPENRNAEGSFYAREPMIVAGTELIEVIYGELGGVDQIHCDRRSGEHAEPGERVAWARGKARTLLTAERTALNFVQRLSGVATLAHQFTEAVRGTKCTVLDTRKTTPALRILEKMAAAAGGVTNHRVGLYDAVLIKNNHIAAAGGVTAALALAIPEAERRGISVEIEVRTIEELDEALNGGAHRLLLDNLSPEEAHHWITRIAGRATTELSGGITLSTVRAYAESGADFVSVGAITHSAHALDLNFRLRLI